MKKRKIRKLIKRAIIGSVAWTDSIPHPSEPKTERKTIIIKNKRHDSSEPIDSRGNLFLL